jgi:hypothetical protein
METAVAAFTEAVQRLGGTGPAIAEVSEMAHLRAWEAAARVFASRPGTWTAQEVATALRAMRGTT